MEFLNMFSFRHCSIVGRVYLWWQMLWLSLVLVLAVFVQGGYSEQDVPAPLTIACDANFMPYTMLNSESQPAGLLIDIWRLWSEKTGIPVHFSFSDWNGSIGDIKSGRADIHSGLFSNPNRREFMDFSDPLYGSSNSVFQPVSQSIITHLSDLAEKCIGVIKGSDAADYLRSHIPNITILEYEKPEDVIRAALNGEIEAVADETLGFLTVLGRLGRAGEFRRIDPPLLEKKIMAAVAKGRSELLVRIDAGFDAISYRELIEIESRWIHVPEARYFRSHKLASQITPAQRRWLREHRVIRVGVDPAAAPFEFMDDSGNYGGIASEYLTLLGDRLGIKFRLSPGKSWSDVIDMGRAGKVDLIACAANTAAQREFLTFTRAYMTFPVVIITHIDTSYIGGILDLSQKTVAVARDYAAHEFIREQHPEVTIMPMDHPLEGLQAVSSGQAFAFVENLATATYLISRHGLFNLKVAASTPYTYRLSFAVPKDRPELADLLNKGLETISPVQVNSISKKWLSLRLEHGINKDVVVKLIFQISGTALIFLMAVFVWNRQIRRREERFRGLTENGMDITQAIAPSGHILYQSPSHAALLGYEENKLVGTSVNNLIHHEDRPVWKTTLTALLSDHQRVTITQRLRHKDGHYRFFESNCINMTANKALGAIVINARDVTDRMLAEKALQAAHAELEDRVLARTAELMTINTQLSQEIEDHKRAKKQILAYQDALRSLASELALTEERERRRIAVDLHDRVSQALALCQIKLGMLQSHIDGATAQTFLNEAIELCTTSLADTRTLTFEISPPSLYELGLEAALDELAEATQEDYGIRTEFGDDGRLKPLAKDVTVTLYRATNELVMNVIKHANADQLCISVGRRQDQIRVVVRDDGVGFDPHPNETESYQTKSFGLLSIRERLGALRGWMEIDSAAGKGTRVTLMAPIDTALTDGGENHASDLASSR
jgi:PAS domain S-box-containing protein